MPVIGMPSGNPGTARVVATRAALGTISGKTARGMRSKSHNSACQVRVAKSISSVRDAFVTSVTCGALPSAPPASCQTKYESTVPKASLPLSAEARKDGSLSNIQASLVPEKYGSKTRPVSSRTRGS